MSKINIKLVLKPKETNQHKTEQLLRLDSICFPDDSPITVKDGWWWLLKDGPSIIGFAGLKIWRQIPTTGFLYRAGIIPRYQGCGLHKRLIKARIRFAKKLGMGRVATYTVSDNYPSMNALVSQGFRFWQPYRRLEGREMLYFLLDLS